VKKIIFVFTALVSTLSFAESDEVKTKVGFLVDTNYSYATNQKDLSESYFTYPTRNNEFGLNLALIQAKVETSKVVANFGLQTGSSVYKYSQRENRVAGANVHQADFTSLIHEASVTYEAMPSLSFQAGIFPVEIAGESFISSKNMTYTRSLIADAMPYFLSGVRAKIRTSDSWEFGLGLVNGFNLLDVNGNKSLAFDIKYQPQPKFSVLFHSLMGEEVRFRFLYDLVVNYQPMSWWEAKFITAIGFQTKPGGGHYAYWFTFNSTQRFRLNETFALGTRLEYYWDKYQTNYTTATPLGFQTKGVSANLDTQLNPNLVWRNEVRYLNSLEAIFGNTAPANDTVGFVTSLTFSAI